MRLICNTSINCNSPPHRQRTPAVIGNRMSPLSSSPLSSVVRRANLGAWLSSVSTLDENGNMWWYLATDIRMWCHMIFYLVVWLVVQAHNTQQYSIVIYECWWCSGIVIGTRRRHSLKGGAMSIHRGRTCRNAAKSKSSQVVIQQLNNLRGSRWAREGRSSKKTFDERVHMK